MAHLSNDDALGAVLGVDDDVGSGLVAIRDMRPVGIGCTKQQLIGVYVELAVVNGLAANENFVHNFVPLFQMEFNNT